MFPSNHNSQVLSFHVSSGPDQENYSQEDLTLILGHGAVDGVVPSKQNSTGKGRQKNPCFGHQDQDKDSSDNRRKRVMHRDIERRRRQEMATLYTSLRNLLPFEYIKGKRATSDHIHETVKYIKGLQKKIKQLSTYRDEIKNLSNLNHISSSSETAKLNRCSPAHVVVRSCFVGVEVVISSAFDEQAFNLSRVLQLLLEEELEVFSCISTKVNQRVIHTIQSKVRYVTHIDLSKLQNQLIETISSL